MRGPTPDDQVTQGLGPVNDPVPGPLKEAILRRLADQKITNKWNSLGGVPGPANTPGHDGLIAVGSQGYYREFANGVIYDGKGHGVHYVYGAIGERYNQLNRMSGWLGWPTSDEQDFVEGGRVTTFENGAIYWWNDTGAIDLADIALTYTGLHCFEETDWDQASNSDEPYAILGAIPALPDQQVTIRTKIYDDVDSGESNYDLIELYRGRPYGATLSVTLMEHDFGDPDKFLDVVKVAVDKASDGVKAAVNLIPDVGPYLAPVAEAVLKAIGPDIVAAVNHILDTDDDKLGVVNFFVSAKQMVLMARHPVNNFDGILWHFDSPDISGEGARYKTYYTIAAV